MKTTIELPDALLREAKAFAAERGIPLREVVQRGIESVVHGRPRRDRPFRLNTIVTDGEGLQIEGSWSEIRSMIYEGRGG